ncbi:hypothetical protein [Microbacterium aurantiacum]
MTKYLISFPSSAMVVTDAELPAVSVAAACRCPQEVRAFMYDPES